MGGLQSNKRLNHRPLSGLTRRGVGVRGMRVAANSVGGNGKISTHSVLRTPYSVLAKSQQVLPFVVAIAANDVFTCRHFLMDYAEASSEFLICPASSRIVACWFCVVVVVVERVGKQRPGDLQDLSNEKGKHEGDVSQAPLNCSILSIYWVYVMLLSRQQGGQV